MVLPDDIDNFLAHLVLPGQFHPIFDMGLKNKTTHGRSQFFVFIFAAELVLHKISGFFDFTDVVIIGGGFGQQGIGADFFRGRFHHVADNNGMVVGARGHQHQLA